MNERMADYSIRVDADKALEQIAELRRQVVELESQVYRLQLFVGAPR